MLCNISQNAMGQPPGGGVPCQVQPGGWVGGILPGGYPGQVHPPARSVGVPSRGVPWQEGVPRLGTPPPSQVSRGGTRRGGYPGQDNIGNTCYTAGDMLLAFMQEDFLVT